MLTAYNTSLLRHSFSFEQLSHRESRLTDELDSDFPSAFSITVVIFDHLHVASIRAVLQKLPGYNEIAF